VFILLFAGHETSAHTLSFALAFLALYPEVQERFLAQIRQFVGPGQLPVSLTVTVFLISIEDLPVLGIYRHCEIELWDGDHARDSENDPYCEC
jgi:cytochrome P450